MNIDKELEDLKIKEINIPDNFEALARATIDKIEVLEKEDKIKRDYINRKRFIKVASIFIVAFICIFLFKDTIIAAYNRLRGYEEYFSYNSFIKELNEEDKLQMINEKIVFESGHEILIEGLVYDGKYLTLFSKDITKENIDLDSKSEFLRIYLNDNIPSMASTIQDKVANDLFIYVYNTEEHLENLNFKIKLNEEEKHLSIKIDESKVLDSKVIEVNKIISSSGINLEMKKVRVSPNSITSTYSITSEDSELIEKIKKNKNSLYGIGISSTLWIDIKYKEFMSTINESVIELENGIEVTEQNYMTDLRLDKMTELKIKLIGIYFSEEIELDKLKENSFYDEDLYIYEIDEEKNEMIYFVRYEKDFSLSKKYDIGYPSIQYIDFQGRENIKEEEFLGKDYKEFALVYPVIDTLKDGKVILSENKIFKMNEEERSFIIRLK